MINKFVLECYNNQFYNNKSNNGIVKAWAIEFAEYYFKNSLEDILKLFPKEEHSQILRFIEYKLRYAFFGDIKIIGSDSNYLNLLKVLDKKYFNDKVILDIGAYDGDSVLQFLKLNPKKIFAFEPNTHLFKRLSKIKDKRVESFDYALSNNNRLVNFKNYDSGSFINDSEIKGLNDKKVLSMTLDNFINEVRPEYTPNVIKMDIEGGEYPAINGAKEIINRYGPVLIIAVYHKARDFFKIPFLLRKLNKNYRFRFLDLSPKNKITEKFLVAYKKC